MSLETNHGSNFRMVDVNKTCSRDHSVVLQYVGYITAQSLRN